jgi:hypothetical protein
LPGQDPEHGPLVAETVELLNRASRYGEAEELAVAALSEPASPEEEAEIRLRVATLTKHSTQRRVEENRRALQLLNISEVTRARHLAWLAYNLALHDHRGQRRAAADEAAAAAASTGDPSRRSWPTSPSRCSTAGTGTWAARYAAEELCALGRTSDATAARRAEPTGAAGPSGACEVAASAAGAASAEEAAAGTTGAAASRDRRAAAPSGRGASAEAVWSPCQTRQAPVSRIAPRAGPRSSTRRRGRCPHAG